MSIILIIMLLTLLVGIGLIIDDVLKDVKKIRESYYDIPKMYRDVKFNLFGIVFFKAMVYYVIVV